MTPRQPTETTETMAYDPMLDVRAMAASLCIDARGRFCAPTEGQLAYYLRGPQMVRLAGMRPFDAERLIREEVASLVDHYAAKEARP